MACWHEWRAHFDPEEDRYYWMCIYCAKITFQKKD